jgi:hypothetical protein
MDDQRDRVFREALDGYRRRAAALTLHIPELEALVARHGTGAAAVAEPPAQKPRTLRPPPTRLDPEFRHRPSPSVEIALAPPNPAPARRGPASRALWLVLAAVVTLGAAGGWMRFSRLQRLSGHRAMVLPLIGSVGLARSGGLLYSLDPARKLLGAIDPATGVLVSLTAFPNAAASGLAVTDRALWSADESGVLYEHAPGGDYAVRRVFSNANRRPTALFWDGSRLWVADAWTHSVYEYTLGGSLTAARQFTLPSGLSPAGLYASNGVLWVLDAASRTIFRFKTQALLEPLDTLSLQEWIAAPQKPTGMVIDGETLWIAAVSPSELHRLDLGRVSFTRADGGRRP